MQHTGVSWLHDLPLKNQTVIDYEDHYYRQRLRALQGVDELVDKLLDRLEESDEIDNTYIIFSSDNGFHIGQHRMPPGKSMGFEEDIRVPFFIRGPGIPEGKTENRVSTHIDLVPTFFELAGIPLREDFDGTPMPLKKNGSKSVAHEHVAVEYWGTGVIEGDFSRIGMFLLSLVDRGHAANKRTAPDGGAKSPNNTYKSARIIGEDYNLYYSVWCTNEHELYDLSVRCLLVSPNLPV